MPRNITVQFADGKSHVYDNVPDEVTPEQIEGRANTDFPEQKVAHLSREPEADKTPSLAIREARALGNVVAGAVRGSASMPMMVMGQTIDRGANERGVDNKYIGLANRPKQVEAGLREMGADTDSGSFTVGKLLGEVAATGGVGPAIAKLAPATLATKLPALINAIKSGGFSTGVEQSAIKSLATRAAGGAITAGAQTALVNPNEVGAGATIGAIAPSAVRAAGKAGMALGRGARALADPFTEQGGDRILRRTLEKFGVMPDDLVGTSAQPTITGARPTLAEQIKRPEGAAGAAKLQDAVRLNPEAAPQFLKRELENNAAQLSTLERLAGRGGARDTAESLRKQTAQVLYDKAFEYTIDPAALSAGEKAARTSLLKIPAIQNALKLAKTDLLNMGFPNKAASAQDSIRALHTAKLALDRQIANAGKTASEVESREGLKSARDRLVKYMEKNSNNHYEDARKIYAEMSSPINQMDIVEEVIKRGTSAGEDLAGNARIMPGKITQAMKDEGQLMKSATGRDLGEFLEKKLTPMQLQELRAVVGEVDRAAAVGRAAAGPNSATAQRLAASNVIDEFSGGLGVVGDGQISNTFKSAISALTKHTVEPKLQKRLLEISLDPTKANELYKRLPPKQASQLYELLSKVPQALTRSAPVMVAQ